MTVVLDATRDFVRGELRDLLDELEERGLAVVPKDALGGPPAGAPESAT